MCEPKVMLLFSTSDEKLHVNNMPDVWRSLDDAQVLPPPRKVSSTG